LKLRAAVASLLTARIGWRSSRVAIRRRIARDRDRDDLGHRSSTGLAAPYRARKGCA
jgi:hypothetical protein